MKRRTPLSVLVLSLALVSLAQAQPGVPDPSRSQAPPFFLVVGRTSQGAQPDPVQPGTVIVSDFANTPIPGATVRLDFSGCCDIALCEAVANGQPATIVDGVVTGTADQNGRVDFIVMGAARDPGSATPPDQYGGCGFNGVTVSATGIAPGFVVLRSSTAVCLDQNGAAGGSNGSSTSDVANVLNLFGSVSLGAPYRGRGDLNQDGNITIGDVREMLLHVGRLGLIGGVGCTAPFSATPAPCP